MRILNLNRALLILSGVALWAVWAVCAELALADYDSGARAYNAEQFDVALAEFRVLADQGNARAQFALGQMYIRGKGVRKSQAEALLWYRKAAEQGFGMAQHNLAIAYDLGKVVPQDYGVAAFWYRKAAEQGDPRSQNNLGICMRPGEACRKTMSRPGSGTREPPSREICTPKSIWRTAIARARTLHRIAPDRRNGIAAPWSNLKLLIRSSYG